MNNSTAVSTFDVLELRKQFPILNRTVHGGKPLVYLDNAATTQKSQAVIDAVNEYYTEHNSNVHRGAHAISAEATAMYESAREDVKKFLGADRQEEIVFTRGTTESINLIANSWGIQNIKEGDEILITGMEHHANIVPWQMLCERTGATLKAVPVLDDGALDLAALDELMTEKTKLFSFVHVSNTTGTVNSVHKLCDLAKRRGVTTVVDGAQSVLHKKIDVKDIGCDFLCSPDTSSMVRPVLASSGVDTSSWTPCPLTRAAVP